MTEITVISGKGGTGKTSITAAMAALANNAVLCDNDVDAANLHLVLAPTTLESHIFQGAWVAKINQEDCTQCGICQDHCRFEAIDLLENDTYFINQNTCEGCRLCERVCPEGAISSRRSDNNHWFISDTRFGTLVHARMGPGEENSGKLVTLLRRTAREISRKQNSQWIINDGPPGIGCAAISSVTGTDMVVIVTEPTKSGFHDLKRVTDLVKSFGIPCSAIINKYDLHQEQCNLVETFLEEQQIPLLAKIPFDKKIIEATIIGKTILECFPGSPAAKKTKTAWQGIVKLAGNGK